MSEHPEDGFVCGSGFDEAEHASFTDIFSTREEAIAAGQEDCGWIEGKWFQTARIVHTQEEMPNQLSAERACDNAENDEWGEALLETWQDKVFGDAQLTDLDKSKPGSRTVLEDLQERLDKVWEEWTKAHELQITCYRFEDIKQHEFSADPE